MFRPNISTNIPFLLGASLLLLGIGIFFFSSGDTLSVPPPAPLSVATNPLPVTASTTILVFGDSITAGYGLPLTDAFPSQLERSLLQQGYSVRVINSGVSGETTAGGLRRAPFASSQGADIVVLALGGNDVLRGVPPASTKQNLEGMIELFKAKGTRVVLAGMRAPSNLGATYVSEFDALYPDLAEKYSLSLVPFLLEGIALDPVLNQADGIHPNKEGARILAEKNILPILLPLLQIQ
jgi:acyl-CoA thioesterase I